MDQAKFKLNDPVRIVAVTEGGDLSEDDIGLEGKIVEVFSGHRGVWLYEFAGPHLEATCYGEELELIK